jgi:hypothetical protein
MKIYIVRAQLFFSFEILQVELDAFRLDVDGPINYYRLLNMLIVSHCVIGHCAGGGLWQDGVG